MTSRAQEVRVLLENLETEDRRLPRHLTTHLKEVLLACRRDSGHVADITSLFDLTSPASAIKILRELYTRLASLVDPDSNPALPDLRDAEAVLDGPHFLSGYVTDYDNIGRINFLFKPNTGGDDGFFPVFRYTAGNVGLNGFHRGGRLYPIFDRCSGRPASFWRQENMCRDCALAALVLLARFKLQVVLRTNKDHLPENKIAMDNMAYAAFLRALEIGEPALRRLFSGKRDPFFAAQLFADISLQQLRDLEDNAIANATAVFRDGRGSLLMLPAPNVEIPLFAYVLYIWHRDEDAGNGEAVDAGGEGGAVGFDNTGMDVE